MWTGSIEDFGCDARGGPWLECWECAGEFRYLHEASEHERISGHAVCDPKERIAEHSLRVRRPCRSPRPARATGHCTPADQAGSRDVAALTPTE